MAGKTKLVTARGEAIVEDESAVAGNEPLNIDVGGTGSLTDRGAAASLLIPYILAKSAVPVTTGNITSETVVATVPIAAGALGSNGQLRIHTSWAATNNANAKTIRARLGGVSGVAFLSANITAVAGCSAVTHIAQNNSTFAQVGSSHVITTGGYAIANAQGSTAAADTASAADLVITAQKGTGTDTLTLQSYLVELLYGA